MNEYNNNIFYEIDDQIFRRAHGIRQKLCDRRFSELFGASSEVFPDI